MKLKKILITSFFLAALGTSLILLGYSASRYSQFLIKQVEGNLETIVHLKTKNIDQYVKSKMERAIDFSSDAFIRESLVKLKKGVSFSKPKKDLEDYITDIKLPIDKDVYEIYILNSDGDIVSESGHEEGFERERYSDFYEDPLYLKGKSVPYFTTIFYDEEFGAKGFAVSAPILHDGRLLGVIILKVGLDSLFEITLDRQGLGETGEVYLINKEGFLVTPSRFLKGEEKGVLVQKIESEHSMDCFDESVAGHLERGERVITFSDYRGEEAIGTHREVLGIGWCLVTKIDKSEAIDKPLKNYILNQLVVSALVIATVTLSGSFVGKLWDKRYEIRKK